MTESSYWCPILRPSLKIEPEKGCHQHFCHQIFLQSPISLSVWKVLKWNIILFSKLNSFFKAIKLRNLAILASSGHLKNYKKLQRFIKIHFLKKSNIFVESWIKLIQLLNFNIRLDKCFKRRILNISYVTHVTYVIPWKT